MLFVTSPLPKFLVAVRVIVYVPLDSAMSPNDIVVFAPIPTSLVSPARAVDPVVPRVMLVLAVFAVIALA